MQRPIKTKGLSKCVLAIMAFVKPCLISLMEMEIKNRVFMEIDVSEGSSLFNYIQILSVTCY